MTTMRPRPGALRATAEEIEHATGLQVEIMGGALVMSPTPRGKHAGIVFRLRSAIQSFLADDLVAVEVVSVPMRDDPDDYCTPDLSVVPEGFLGSDDWLIDADEVELGVEVISQSERAKDITGKVEWYAAAGVRLLLVVDPRDGSWTLRSHPRDGEYQGVLRGKFGDLIELPAPFGLSIETAMWPRYGDN